MAYEVFKRKAIRVEHPTLSIVPDGRITLNAAAVRILIAAGVRSALLLWDKTTNRLAIKGAQKNDSNSFAISIVKGTYSGSLRAKSFLSYIGWNSPRREMLTATWYEKDKMLEVTLPKQYVGGEESGNQRRKPKATL